MLRSSFLVVVAVLVLGGCVTSHVEDARETVTGLNAGESIVIMAKSYHQGNETESDYITCVENALRSGSKGINVVPHQQFVDNLELEVLPSSDDVVRAANRAGGHQGLADPDETPRREAGRE